MKNKVLGLRTIFFYIFVILFMIYILFPFLWQIITSVKPPDDLWKTPPKFIPSRPYFEYFTEVFTKYNFVTYLKNSFIIACSTTLISVFISSFAAYALARLKFKGKMLILSLVLSVSMFPGIAIVSPLFIFLKNMSLLNTYFGLILTYTTFTIPFSLWNLNAFFKQIPFELEESAKIDGATSLQTLFKVIFPLATPGMFTSAILTFITAWNEFLFSLVFNTQDAMRTVPVGITTFAGEYELPWGDMAAASVVITIPLIIMVIIFEKQILSGLTAGAVKG